jgi:16S rRNA (guanine527-N7)-methyltransferase
MDEKALRVRQICLRNGVSLTDEQLDQLGRFAVGLLEWNKAINVVSRKDEENFWYAHILHSLTPLFLLDIPERARILDLGSGGGLPGIPISILRPDLSITLLDSIAKKTKVMEDLATKLALKKVKVRTGRAEEIGREKEEKHMYDLVLARAVAPLVDLIVWGRPFLSQGGVKARRKGESQEIELAALKGGDLSAEIAVARVKTKAAFIQEVPIAFEGSVEIGLEEKKIVIVHR